jgi:hypothetical protein
MDQSQVPPDAAPAPTGGCGCGGTTRMVYAQQTSPLMTEQQAKLAEMINRVNQRRNSVYKTKTRLFL